MALPPLEAGAAKVTVARALPGVAETPPGAPGTVAGVTTAEFADAVAAFRAGDYAKAARALPSLGQVLPKNRDYYLYVLGESQFYAGDYGQAQAAFAAANSG